jgi:hypothetical protein
MPTSSFPTLLKLIPLLLVCGGWAHAQEGSNSMVPTITQPSGFGIDTIGAFLCGSPANVPHGSKAAVNALEAAFSDRKASRVRVNSKAPAVGSADLAPMTTVRLSFWNAPFRTTNLEEADGLRFASTNPIISAPVGLRLFVNE